MPWLIERKLADLAKKSQPGAAFARNLEHQLKNETGHRLWWIQSWKWAASSITILTIVGSATGVYAYTSDAVLPDHPLYVIRQGIESVEEAVATTPEKKAEVQVKNLKRRLHENELMVDQNKPIAKEQVAAFVKDVQNTIDASASLPAQKQADMDSAVAKIAKCHEDALIKQQKQAATDSEKIKIASILKDEQDTINAKVQSLQGDRKKHFQK